MKLSYGSVVIFGLLTCAGCAQTVTVHVSGTGTSPDPIPQHVTYTVMPTNEVETDAAFPEYARLVSTKMDARGYKKTTGKTAQLGVYLAYASTAVGTSATADGAPVPPMSAGAGMGPSGPGGGDSYGMATSTPSEATSRRQYKNQLVIVVLDLQKSRGTGAAAELWRGETMNTSSSNDLTQLAPLMVEAAFQHFGETTSARHEFTDEESKKIRESQ